MIGRILSIFYHSEWVKFYLHILQGKTCASAIIANQRLCKYSVSILIHFKLVSKIYCQYRLYGVSQSRLRRAELTPKLNFQACGLLLTKRVLVEIFPMAVSFIKPPVPATCLSCLPWSHLSSWLHLSPGGRRLRALSVGLFPLRVYNVLFHLIWEHFKAMCVNNVFSYLS